MGGRAPADILSGREGAEQRASILHESYGRSRAQHAQPTAVLFAVVCTDDWKRDQWFEQVSNLTDRRPLASFHEADEARAFYIQRALETSLAHVIEHLT